MAQATQEEVPFSETQVGADGKRYPTKDVDAANEAIAAGETPKALEYAPTGDEQKGSGTPTGVSGDKLAADHSTGKADAVPAEPKATTTTK